jgi:hypothetical protein
LIGAALEFAEGIRRATVEDFHGGKARVLDEPK